MLSLDALSSVAYGPEAIVLVLAAAGTSALGLTLPVTLAIARQQVHLQRLGGGPDRPGPDAAVRPDPELLAAVGLELELGRIPERPQAAVSLVIVPVSDISKLTEHALRAALSLGDDVIATGTRGCGWKPWIVRTARSCIRSWTTSGRQPRAAGRSPCSSPLTG